jgi:uncharacterized protein YjbI with pentapeptide repeats
MRGAEAMNEHIRSPKGKLIELDLSNTFIRRVDLSNANLEGADLSHADCSFAIFRGANFKDANLKQTVLFGADLTNAINLTREQIAEAKIDKATILPSYLQ